MDDILRGLNINLPTPLDECVMLWPYQEEVLKQFANNSHTRIFTNAPKDKETQMPKEDNDKAAEGLSPSKGLGRSNDPTTEQEALEARGRRTQPGSPSRASLRSRSASWNYEPVYPLEFKFTKTKEGAVAPSRSHESDSGYDLTIIDVVKNYGKTKLYGTGIKIQPPEGIYFDMVARSSISKMGYVLTNSVGVIDNQFRGELLVALTKIDDSKPDLELPLRIAQLIPRQWLDLKPIEITEEELTSVERGEAGWGSTGK